MVYAGPLDYFPIWGLFAVTVGLVALSIEVGYRVGRYRRRSSEDEKESPVGAIIGATLGLLAFVLAFTFGLATSRFDARRQVVVEEANAIGTTYLRAGLLPSDAGGKARKLLTEYVDVRLQAVITKNIEKALGRSEEIQTELWKQAEEIGKGNPQSVVVGLYIKTLNETIDVHSKRRFIALENALPAVYWYVLYMVTILTMAGVGYYEGLVNSKRSPSLVVLVLSFAVIMMLIADLDSPQHGFLTVSQQSLVELRKGMSDTP